MKHEYICETDGRITEQTLAILVDVLNEEREGILREGDEGIFREFGSTYEEVRKHFEEHIPGCDKCGDLYKGFSKMVGEVESYRDFNQ